VKKSIKEKFGKKNKENFAHINQQAKLKPWASAYLFPVFEKVFI
jgi:hypothetical protein